MIKLIFAGELISGFEQETVVANLAGKLKQPPERIRERLFSGNPVVVKQVDSEQAAHRWRAAFADAGAVLHTAPADLREDGKLAPTVAVRKLAKPHRQKLYLWSSFGVLILAAVLAAGFWLSRPLWQSYELNAQQQALLEALAGDDIYLLGHVNLEQVRSLEALGGDEIDLQALSGTGDGFWSSLEKAGIDIREQIDHVWGAGYLDDSDGQFLLVFTGSFDPDQFTQWMSDYFLIEDATADGILFTWLDESTCEKRPAMLAQVSGDRIVLGDPNRVSVFQQRLAGASPAALDVSVWQTLSGSQPVSIAAFVPENIGTGVKGIPGLALQGLGEAIGPASGFYLGLEPVLVPPGIELNGNVVSEDDEFLQGIHDQLNSGLESAKTEAVQIWPETAKIYDRLSVTLEPGYMRAAVRFDENLQQDISDWVSSLFSISFSGGQEATPGEERLASDPPEFQTIKSTDFASYNENQHLHNSFHAQATSGPFGFAIKGLELTDESQLAIDIALYAFNLPNLGKRGPAITARIIDVFDHQGQPLLLAPPCGPDSARESSKVVHSIFPGWAFIDGEQVPYQQVIGSKVLTLPVGTKPADIGIISGAVDYRLPVTVERVALQAPLGGQVIEKHGVRLRFLSNDKHSLNYQYSGNTDALLHVYALNDDGKPLASGGGTSTGGLLGSGQSVSTNYHGTITGVEVVLASDFEHLSYPFELHSAQPVVSEQAIHDDQPRLLTGGEWEALRVDNAPGVNFQFDEPKVKVPAGPALIAVQRSSSFDSQFGFNLGAGVYISNRYPMVGALGAGELAVTEVVTADEQRHQVDYRAHFSFQHGGGYWLDDEYQPDEERPWHKGELNIRDRNLKINDPQALRGTLTLNAVRATKTVSLPLFLGSSWQNTNFSITLTKWEGSTLVFTPTGNLSELVAIQALSENGSLVSQAAKMRWMFGRQTIEVELGNQPESLALVIASKLSSEQYPFELALADPSY